MSGGKNKLDDNQERWISTEGILLGIIVILAFVLLFLLFEYQKASQGKNMVDTGADFLTENVTHEEADVLDESELYMKTDSQTDLYTLVETECQADSVFSLETETVSAQEGLELVLVLGADETEPFLEDSELLERNEEEETDIESEPYASAEEEYDKLVVAIDPGHQGSWVDMSDTEPLGPGSTEMKAKASTGTQGSYSQVPEYELNLEISLLLREELEDRGYKVILTREDNDTAISNAERALLAYENGGDIYVRIHANGSENSSVSGALAMVPSSSNPYVGNLAEDSFFLAECILNAYCDNAGFESLGIQYSDNMTGINWSKIPVMILEMGFMTNKSDDLRMNDEDVQLLMAQGIADGIDAYFEQKGMEEEDILKLDDSDMNFLEEMIAERFVYPAADMGESWAVSVLKLDTGAMCSVNGDVQLKSASVMKAFIMAAFYDRVLTPASEENKIVVEEYTEEELKNFISKMITVSDNGAANTLVILLGEGDAGTGIDVVNDYLEENGFTGTSMGRLFLEENPSGDNYTTSNDCARLLESIYQGTCVSKLASSQMYEYLKQQTITGKIPSALTDEEVITANKTGELAGDYGDYVENDIATVWSEEKSYVLSILSNDLKDNTSAVSRINQISALVYDTLMK